MSPQEIFLLKQVKKKDEYIDTKILFYYKILTSLIISALTIEK